jgi:Ca2+/Na+ antiporter
MSIFWIWFLATNLVDSLKFIGVIFDIPSSFLAMTVLSFGNSIPDLSLNAALAKAGFGQMGIAGSIAGPLFNLLIGLGASLIRKCIKNGGTIEFEFFSHGNLVVIVAIAVLFMNLLRLMIQAYLIKFRLNKSVSAIGYVLYSLFFIAICVITFAFGE